jgi:hypothetical protein
MVNGTTKRLMLVAVCVLCAFTTGANAQDKGAKGKSIFPNIFGSDPNNCPTCEIMDLDRIRIRCDARATAYTRQGCDQTCTAECKRIGTSLRACDSATSITCAQ